MEFGLILVPLLVLVSGAIAYIGNLVGRNIGRRRLTLFGLRPRHTAQVITVVSGMLIALVTLAAVLLVSADARTALFRFRELQAQTARLEGEIDQAEARLRQLKGGDIAYLTNQEVLRGLVDARLPLVRVRAAVDMLRLRAVDLALENGIGVDGQTGSVLILFPPRLTWDRVAELVRTHPGETVVRIVANQNTLRGEPLEVYIQLLDNVLAFRRGTVLLRGTVDGRARREEIGRQVLELVERSAEPARRRMLSPPFARITDPPLVQAAIDDVRRLVAEIDRLGRPVGVEVVVSRDTFTVGPVLVTVRLRG